MYTYQFVYVNTARKMTDVNPGSKLVYLRNTPAMQKKTDYSTCFMCKQVRLGGRSICWHMRA